MLDSKAAKVTVCVIFPIFLSTIPSLVHLSCHIRQDIRSLNFAMSLGWVKHLVPPLFGSAFFVSSFSFSV